MKSRRIDRRQALLHLAALAALPLVGCPRESDPARLVALRRDRRSAALLGRAWLDDQSPTPSAADLVALVCGESGCESPGGDAAGMRRAIVERHRSDFERGNLVSVDGWLLSETEAALYALVALGS